MIATLSEWPVIIGAACALAVLVLAFWAAAGTTGGKLLDSLLLHRAAVQRLTEMSPAQRRNHIIITLLLDTLYPLVYGVLFAGLIWRFGEPKMLYAAPVAALMVADFAENAAQVAALSGAPKKTLRIKTALTWLKFGLVQVVAFWLAFLVVWN